jgi:hypothetical protein
VRSIDAMVGLPGISAASGDQGLHPRVPPLQLTAAVGYDYAEEKTEPWWCCEVPLTSGRVLSMGTASARFSYPGLVGVFLYLGSSAGYQVDSKSLEGEYLGIGPAGVTLQMDDFRSSWPLLPDAIICVSVEVTSLEPLLVPGAMVEVSGALEGPGGPLAADQLDFLVVGALRNPRLVREALAPFLQVQPGALPTDLPTVRLRGQVVAVQPTVIVQALGQRLPLRLPERQRFTVRIYHPAALQLCTEGDRAWATLVNIPRLGGTFVQSLTVRHGEALSKDAFEGAVQELLGGRAKRPRNPRTKVSPTEEGQDATPARAPKRPRPAPKERKGQPQGLESTSGGQPKAKPSNGKEKERANPPAPADPGAFTTKTNPS